MTISVKVKNEGAKPVNVYQQLTVSGPEGPTRQRHLQGRTVLAPGEKRSLELWEHGALLFSEEVQPPRLGPDPVPVAPGRLEGPPQPSAAVYGTVGAAPAPTKPVIETEEDAA